MAAPHVGFLLASQAKLGAPAGVRWAGVAPGRVPSTAPARVRAAPTLPTPSACAGADVAALEAAAAAGGKAAASRGVARSDRVLVVKNLPFTASLEELEALFGAIGGLLLVVLVVLAGLLGTSMCFMAAAVCGMVLRFFVLLFVAVGLRG